MLQNIPTHVIAGPLGAGKTSLIKHLLSQKPPGERWAILINEFGQIGLDAALLTTAADGIALGEVAGGCLCCVNGAPFQIGLGRLLRKARPDRLFIEPSGLGHPLQLIEQLKQAPWLGVLSLQPSVMVLDASALASGQPLPVAQQEALQQTGLMVLNKSASLTKDERESVTHSLPDCARAWTDQGKLLLNLLPGIEAHANAAVDKFEVPKTLAQMPAVWSRPELPICLSQQRPEGWSIGWRWHPDQRFSSTKVQRWLEGLDWRRAKWVIHSETGWVSGNALDGEESEWSASEWRRDSRLELIFALPQDEASLRAGLAGCVIQDHGPR
ncbi:CobW family GTP-binding protein [Pseudomonas huanghezhanensis]|uniref:CobW family GTP-binding protein n=1 Tax=Pseudomonas huanghezhanensis TaxID=3002903 RepID=UPI0022864906|nr:CobW-like GTP-binding protein [Pseudomonas sp. BSw22131]